MKKNFEIIDRIFSELGITSKFGAFSENLVNKVEETFEIKLPDDYRMFLIKYGKVNFSQGICYSVLNKYPSSESNNDEPIVNFYGLQDDDFNIIENIDCYLGRMPDSLIPIAECPGGDQLCIGVEGKEKGKIYYWDHNLEQLEPQSEDLWYNIYLTSNSFLDFIKTFKVRIEKDLGDLGILEVKMSAEFLALLKDK